MKQTNFDQATYNEIQRILDIVEDEGLVLPRDVDVLADTLLCTIDKEEISEDLMYDLVEFLEDFAEEPNNDLRLAITDLMEEIAGLVPPIEQRLN